MSNYQADVPLINVPFVGPDGRVSEAWFMFLIQMFRRTGGAAGTALDDLATDVATMADDPAVSALSHALNEISIELQALPVAVDGATENALLKALQTFQSDVGDAVQDAIEKARRAIQDAAIENMTPLDPIRSMALQEASRVRITGGTINGTPIGATTPSTGRFTNLTLTAATPTVGAGQLGFGTTASTTVGAAGGAAALPATPSGYLVININGANFKLPYFNS